SQPRSRKSRSNSPLPRLALVTDAPATDEASRIVADFLTRYPNPATASQYRSKLADLFATSGARHPADLTEADLIRWCTGNGAKLANNTIRQRISSVRTYFGWCRRAGHI